MSVAEAKQYYVPLDDYLDIERLQSLDGILRAKLDAFLNDREQAPTYFSAGERLDPAVPGRIGTRTVRLMDQTSGGYYQIHDASCWQKTALADEFPELMAFVNDLPFESYGRAFIIFDDNGISEPVHRDHGDPDLHQEFIWFRPNKVKRFYVYDKASKEKHYVQSYACWFDTRHYHGTDPAEGLSMSIRVDGVFTPEFRRIVSQCPNLVQPRDLTVAEKIKRRLYNAGKKLGVVSPASA